MLTMIFQLILFPQINDLQLPKPLGPVTTKSCDFESSLWQGILATI